jgi:hypothetical protein
MYFKREFLEVVKPCSSVEVQWRLAEKYCLHLQYRIRNRSKMKWKNLSSGILRSAIRCKLTISRWFLAWLILRPWRWRRHVSPKRRLTFNGLQCLISHKMELFITPLWERQILHGKLLIACFLFVVCLAYYRPWWWRLYVPPKRRWTYNRLRCVTSISMCIDCFRNLSHMRSSLKHIFFTIRLDMQGWATKLALALRPLMIYCASPLD